MHVIGKFSLPVIGVEYVYLGQRNSGAVTGKYDSVITDTIITPEKYRKTLGNDYHARTVYNADNTNSMYPRLCANKASPDTLTTLDKKRYFKGSKQTLQY